MSRTLNEHAWRVYKVDPSLRKSRFALGRGSRFTRGVCRRRDGARKPASRPRGAGSAKPAGWFGGRVRSRPATGVSGGGADQTFGAAGRASQCPLAAPVERWRRLAAGVRALRVESVLRGHQGGVWLASPAPGGVGRRCQSGSRARTHQRVVERGFGGARRPRLVPSGRGERVLVGGVVGAGCRADQPPSWPRCSSRQPRHPAVGPDYGGRARTGQESEIHCSAWKVGTFFSTDRAPTVMIRFARVQSGAL